LAQTILGSFPQGRITPVRKLVRNEEKEKEEEVAREDAEEETDGGALRNVDEVDERLAS
jgi:hypothetical protein